MIRQLSWIAVALTLPIAWFVAHGAGLLRDPVAVALVSGAGIFGASFLLSWISEVAQLDIPQALALAFLALIAVLPEYAVDVYFAWRAGQDPSYTAFAAANMTGSNRLLLGVGWAAPVLVVWARTGRRVVELPREQAVEVNYLALATLYSFLIPLKGTLSLVDTIILFAIFVAYLRAAGRSHHHEPEIEGPAEALVRLGPTGRRVAVLLLAAVAGATILTAAEPFAESLIATGRHFGIEEFLLVQWLAPLASEAPEFIVAIVFALKGAAAAGIGTMVSSKVNQWTLLVGALPAAFALSHGSVTPMHLDMRQREEIFLTSAQSVLGLVAIANFRFAVGEALALFVLFAAQFFFTSPASRWIYATGYLVVAAGIVVWSADVRRSVRTLLPRPRSRAR